MKYALILLFSISINLYNFSQSNDYPCPSTNNFSRRHDLHSIHGLNNIYYSTMPSIENEIDRIQFVCIDKQIERVHRKQVDIIDNSSSILYEWIGNELDIKLSLDNSIYRIDSVLKENKCI